MTKIVEIKASGKPFSRISTIFWAALYYYNVIRSDLHPGRFLLETLSTIIIIVTNLQPVKYAAGVWSPATFVFLTKINLYWWLMSTVQGATAGGIHLSVVRFWKTKLSATHDKNLGRSALVNGGTLAGAACLRQWWGDPGDRFSTFNTPQPSTQGTGSQMILEIDDLNSLFKRPRKCRGEPRGVSANPRFWN